MEKAKRIEGSYRQRENGSWIGQYYSGQDQNGRRIRKSVYGKTKAEVVNKVYEALRGSDHGEAR